MARELYCEDTDIEGLAKSVSEVSNNAEFRKTDLEVESFMALRELRLIRQALESVGEHLEEIAQGVSRIDEKMPVDDE